nr:glutactin [Drosophila bipectinata]
MKPLYFVLALCVAQSCALYRGRRSNDYDDDYDSEEEGQWKKEHLKPEPWKVRHSPPVHVPQDLSSQQAPQYAQDSREVVVQAPEVGEVVGVRGFKSNANGLVNAFLGIRYGKVGSGLARFQAAQPTGYQGRVNANVKSPNCAQFPELQRLRESEARGENVDDCLTLDIYAPEHASNLPVLVFVHGEMLFDGGSEEAQPDYVLEKDVVLVSINYRLAPFGFLSALSDELPGNVALADIHLALEWLQKNLESFGGNPGQVTLLGQAGGATLIHALSLSGRASGLFQQLILQSGTALNPYLIDERPLETLDTFASFARCPTVADTRSLAPLYDCLGSLPTSQLVDAFEQLFNRNEPLGLSSLGAFKLVVGDPLGYLPKPPVALAANASNAVPTIIGATKDASAFILSRFYKQIENVRSYNVSDYIDVVLRHLAPPSEHQIWKQWALREIFSPDQVRSVDPSSVSQGLLELSNMILYRAPVIFSIRNSYSKSPVYLYNFAYRGEHHRFEHVESPLPFAVDASLSDDNVYVFPYPVETSQLNAVDRSLSRALVTMWVNFATTGVPNSNSGVWPRASSEYGPVLRISNSGGNLLELDPHFGEGIYVPNLYANYFNTTTKSTPVVIPVSTITTTTTTTTRRPYVHNPYSNWQNRQPQQTWPAKDSAEEARRKQEFREYQQREAEERRREYQLRLQQQQEQLQRERLEREKKLQEQQQREQELQEQQEQLAREQERREQQWREQQQREQQQREQQRREQQEGWRAVLNRDPVTYDAYGREITPDFAEQERQKQEREQQEREDQRREQERREYEERLEQDRQQREREQQEREQPDQYQPDKNTEDNLHAYPTYEDYVKSQQGEQSPESDPERNYAEEQQREQERLEQERQQREQEQREDEERLEQERQQREREQQEREQQEGQPEENPEDGRQPYPTYEDYARGQQGEQSPESDQEQQREQERLEQERQLREQERREYEERLQREREQQEREQEQSQGQSDNDPSRYPSYEDYVRSQQEGRPSESDSDRNYDEEQEREQQRRDQLRQEQEQEYGQSAGYPGYEGPQEESVGQDQENQPEVDPQNDPSNYATYEDYVQAQLKLRQEEEERDRALREEEERQFAQAEAAEEAARQSHQPIPYTVEFRRFLNAPRHTKLIHRQQDRRQ